MWNNMVGTAIWRSSRRFLMLGLLALAPSLVLIAITTPRLLAAWQGPALLQAGDLARMADSSEPLSGYGAIQPDATWLTDFSWTDANTGRRYFEYRVLRVGDAYVLAGGDPSNFSPRPVCAVEARTLYEEKNVVPAVETQHPDLRGKILPLRIVLQDPDSAANEALTILFILAVLAAPGLALIGLALFWRWKPQTNPLAYPLRRFGPPASVAEAVEKEAENERTEAAGRVLLTPTWLVVPIRSEKVEGRGLIIVHPVFFAWLAAYWIFRWLVGGFSVFRLADLVWVFKARPAGAAKGSDLVYLFDRYGYTIQIPGTPPEVDQIVAWIVMKAPWVLTQYQPQIAALWKTNRPALVEMVDHRRRDFQPDVDPAGI